MTSVVLEKEQAMIFWERLVRQHRVMGPKQKEPGCYVFDWLASPDELALDYVSTILPPKKAFFPPKDVLLRFQRGSSGTAAKVEPVFDVEPFVLVGVHPCDLEAIAQLDWAFSQGHVDPHYWARRDAATIIGVNCFPDEYCFCTSVDTARPRGGYDLFLTPIAAGYFVEVGTEKGQQLLESLTTTREPEPQDITDAQNFTDEKKRRVGRHIKTPVSSLPLLLDASLNSPVWAETAEKCYSCGSCTTVCPTCFCFDVCDEMSMTLTGGERVRTWDSCQFVDFAKVAGGGNFRSERVARVRHRWYRKFYYLMARYGRAFCVGCGRCARACTAKIGLVEVLNDLTVERENGAEPVAAGKGGGA